MITHANEFAEPGFSPVGSLEPRTVPTEGEASKYLRTSHSSRPDNRPPTSSHIYNQTGKKKCNMMHRTRPQAKCRRSGPERSTRKVGRLIEDFGKLAMTDPGRQRRRRDGTTVTL